MQQMDGMKGDQGKEAEDALFSTASGLLSEGNHLDCKVVATLWDYLVLSLEPPIQVG